MIHVPPARHQGGELSAHLELSHGFQALPPRARALAALRVRGFGGDQHRLAVLAVKLPVPEVDERAGLQRVVGRPALGAAVLQHRLAAPTQCCSWTGHLRHQCCLANFAVDTWTPLLVDRLGIVGKGQ